MAISFDGPNLTITLSSGDTTVEVAEIYSRWKDWVLAGNVGYYPAFRETGGDPLGGGVYAGVNVFIRNDLGWRIKPPEEDIIINLVGNLYPEDPDTVWRAPTTGGYDTEINTNNSANLLLFDSGGGGSAPSAASIADAVWDELLSGHTISGSTGEKMGKLLTLAKFLGLK